MKENQQLQELMDHINQWADQTFGADRSPMAPIHHLKKEVLELIEAYDKLDHRAIGLEFADCFILLLNGAAKYGLLAEDIFDLIDRKMEINQSRKWSKPDENGVSQHID